MNNTQTLAIVAVLTAATLVVGVTFAATTPSTSAYTKKGSHNNGSDKIKGNDNTDTDTIQKCKQFASGFDPTFGDQNCDILSSSTINPTPTTGILLVKKVEVCVLTVCPVLSDFTITVTGNNPIPSTPFPASVSGTLVTLGTGTFTVTETTSVGGFTTTFSGDCTQSGPLTATGTISAGQHLTCTVTNTQQRT